jgi:hypothetical protein
MPLETEAACSLACHPFCRRIICILLSFFASKSAAHAGSAHHFKRGNTGSQASTLIIQAMAKAEITISDWFTI